MASKVYNLGYRCNYHGCYETGTKQYKGYHYCGKHIVKMEKKENIHGKHLKDGSNHALGVINDADEKFVFWFRESIGVVKYVEFKEFSKNNNYTVINSEPSSRDPVEWARLNSGNTIHGYKSKTNVDMMFVKWCIYGEPNISFKKHESMNHNINLEPKQSKENNMENDQMKLLNSLFEYEKNCLSVIKEFKEEIKFASSLQEDIRKERTSFFLKDFAEISKNLKESQIDDAVAAEWLKELVNSYTKSLDLSSDLAKTHMLDLLGIIKSNMKDSLTE